MRAPCTPTITSNTRIVLTLALVMTLMLALYIGIDVLLSMTSTSQHAHASINTPAVTMPGNVSLQHYFTHLMQQQAVRVMPLGDSITLGEKSSDLGGYRTYLWQDCVQEGWNVDFVGSQQKGPATLADRDNEGHSGWRIDQISAHIKDWLTLYRPQVLLLHIGTNDMIQRYGHQNAIRQLKQLLTQITTLAPESVLLVAQIVPLHRGTLNTEVIAYNRAIPALVRTLATQGKHIASVDMYDAVPVSALKDGAHPNDQGYKLMAQVWLNALQSIL